ncbi:MAG: outer membrane beta-barrel protein [Muribaculaceae bacterium]|nr:outer membrane beta-barrel protein [Muribaculaceae bacterium]
MFIRRLISLVLFSTILLASSAGAEEKKDLYLYGRIKESVGKTDLLKAMVLLPDSTGEKFDTIRVSGKVYRNGEMEDTSDFGFPVFRKDSTYVFDVICEGYQPYTVVYDVSKVGKRERYRQIPVVYMTRAPRRLDEVTVTASKIKFYNKGDTVVFNADAFQLAEGSMLDALIGQLPGVELNENGQIKVNGEFVESLLLNGKQFLDGDNQLMLENIAAYTVKNVEVYQGQTKGQKWDNDQKKQLTMDVKLKREYNHGWLINAQGGYGTKDRYTGRLFASWFSPTTNISLIGNVNNLNDNREPGKNDTWTPDMMPSGTKEYRMGSLNYDYESPESDRAAYGSFAFKQTVNRNNTATARTNFLSGGNTYDNSFQQEFLRDTRYDTRHDLSIYKEKYRMGLFMTGRYRDRKTNASTAAATFDTEQQEMTMKAIEAMYSDGSPINLNSVVNRSITKTDGSHKELSGHFEPMVGWKIPNTSDVITFRPSIAYKSEKEERWNDYTVNYGADPNPADRRRQYFDNTPNHTLTHEDDIYYRTSIREVYLMVRYLYQFKDQVKDSYMYALDRLEDMGIFGTLPAGYIDTFDPQNSYTSRHIENTHNISAQIAYDGVTKDLNLRYGFFLLPSLAIRHSHFDYMRAGRSQTVKRTDLLFTLNSWACRWMLNFGKIGEGRNMRYRHNFTYRLEVTPSAPDPMDMVDAVNDSDPLNIHTGNPDLKPEHRISNILTYEFKPSSPKLENSVTFNYSTTRNALTNGYVYDTETGVRRTRTYNTDGNSQCGISNSLRYQFGSIGQFTLSSETALDHYSYGDMIGVNLSEPTLSKVGSTNFNEKLTLSWQIGRQQLQLRGGYINRHTTSDRADFTAIDADHFTAGVTGQFRLPAGFGISTDFTLYTRRGYGVKELDTSDAIWNMRLTWSPTGNKRWVFMLDGFDMLHQLSNVSYAVSATGRTVSYSNALPRYMLLSVQYRLNIQPKKH